MKQIRQGDVLLVAAVAAVPAGLQPVSSVVLAEGEATGHAHVLAAPVVYDWSVDGQRYVRVSGGIGTISHQEHDPIPAAVVSPDITYRVIPQQEWNLKGQWKNVLD